MATHAAATIRRLAAARRVRLRVRTSRGTIVRGRGHVVSRDGTAGPIIVEERGIWRNLDGFRARYASVTRWTRRSDGDITLEHLRRGESEPVRLVELATRDGSTWFSRSPHVCGEDRYSARVRVTPSGVRVRWRIRGPRKQLIVEMFYHAVADAAATPVIES